MSHVSDKSKPLNLFQTKSELLALPPLLGCRLNDRLGSSLSKGHVVT